MPTDGASSVHLLSFLKISQINLEVLEMEEQSCPSMIISCKSLSQILETLPAGTSWASLNKREQNTSAAQTLLGEKNSIKVDF